MKTKAQSSVVKRRNNCGFAVLEVVIVVIATTVLFSTLIAYTEKVALHNYAEKVLQRNTENQVQLAELENRLRSSADSASPILTDLNLAITTELIAEGLAPEHLTVQTQVIESDDASHATKVLAHKQNGTPANFAVSPSDLVRKLLLDYSEPDAKLYAQNSTNRYLSNNAGTQRKEATIFLISRILIERQTLLGELLNQQTEIYAEIVLPLFHRVS